MAIKKSFVLLAVLLIIAGGVAAAYSVERFMAAGERMTVSDEQAANSEAAKGAGSTDQATRFMEYSADNAKLSTEAQTMGIVAALGALVLFVAGGVVVRRGKE